MERRGDPDDHPVSPLAYGTRAVRRGHDGHRPGRPRLGSGASRPRRCRPRRRRDPGCRGTWRTRGGRGDPRGSAAGHLVTLDIQLGRGRPSRGHGALAVRPTRITLVDDPGVVIPADDAAASLRKDTEADATADTAD